MTTSRIDRGAAGDTRQRRTFQGLANAGFVPLGASILNTGGTAPEGFLVADGSAVSRTVYADLFRAIGTTYGAGDGATTFNLPSPAAVNGIGWIIRSRR